MEKDRDRGGLREVRGLAKTTSTPHSNMAFTFLVLHLLLHHTWAEVKFYPSIYVTCIVIYIDVLKL